MYGGSNFNKGFVGMQVDLKPVTQFNRRRGGHQRSSGRLGKEKNISLLGLETGRSSLPTDDVKNTVSL
jgi:hypothetical protein